MTSGKGVLRFEGERYCPQCGALMLLQRKLPPVWNWTGIQTQTSFWRCCACTYTEPTGAAALPEGAPESSTPR